MSYSIANTWPTIVLAIALVVLLSYREVAVGMGDGRTWWMLFVSVFMLFLISFRFWRAE